MAKQLDLTANEKEFLGAAARVGDESEWPNLYRAAKCKGHEGADGTIKARITRLLKRETAGAYFEQEKQRHHRAQVEAQRKADGAAFKEAEARAKLNEDLLTKLDDVFLARVKYLVANPQKSTADIAKLAEVAHRVAGKETGRAPLTTEQRKEMLKEYREQLRASQATQEKPLPQRGSAPPPVPAAVEDWRGGKA